MHRMICFVLNIFKRLYISIYIKSHLLMKKLVSPLFFSPVFDILGLVFLYLLLTQILWTLKRKKNCLFISVEASSGLFTHPHSLHLFCPSVRWFVRDLHLPNTACGKLHFPGLLSLILWFIKSLSVPRDSNISGSD